MAFQLPPSSLRVPFGQRVDGFMPTEPLAIFRVWSVVLAFVYTLGTVVDDFPRLLVEGSGNGSWDLLIPLPGTREGLWVYVAACLVGLSFLLVGWFTRWAALATCILMASLVPEPLWAFGRGGAILVQALLLLDLFPGARTWSVDSIRRSLREFKDPPAGFELATPRPRPAVTVLPRAYFRGIQALALIHLGMGLTMSGGPHWMTLAFLPLFIPTAWIGWATDRLSRPPGAGATRVAYDTFCPLCRRVRRVLARLDLGRRLSFVDIHDRVAMAEWFPKVSYGQALREMQVQAADGATHSGFRAFRALTRVLPLFRWWRWLLFVPGVAWGGSLAYGWVARRRYRWVTCSSATCSLHLQALSQESLNEDAVAELVARAREAAP